MRVSSHACLAAHDGLHSLIDFVVLAVVSTVFLVAGMVPTPLAPARFSVRRICVATQSLYAVVPVMIGMAVGTALRNRLSPATFRTWFFVGMLLIGGYMVLRAALVTTP